MTYSGAIFALPNQLKNLLSVEILDVDLIGLSLFL
jgi:hypothetical protein